MSKFDWVQMDATSHFAQSQYAPQLQWAARYGQDQIEHTFRSMLEEFNTNAWTAALSSSVDNIIQAYEDRVAKGLLDSDPAPDDPIAAITFAGAKALTIEMGAGEHLLLTWKVSDSNDIEF